ncbi:MAG: glycosyltransferase family 2 protein [Candidatus Falkowbacteria bacterium]
MNKKIGVILINYKDYAERFLAPCRDSLRAQTYPRESTNIYIIDNASTVESFEYLQNIYPEAKIFARTDGNYAAANNLGFKEAAADACEYIVTANMDTEMTKEWLSELIRALDDNPEAGIAQSKILLFPKNDEEKKYPKINSLGNVIHYLGFGFTSGYGEADKEIEGCPEIKGYASGASFIIRSSVLAKIGGYNEEYYMYHDDMEISLKAKLAGYKIILAPKSVIFHKYEFKRSTRMIYYMERNRYLTLLTFYPLYLVILIAIPGVVMDIGMLFFSLINGWFKEELKIYGYFCHSKNYDKIVQEREKVRAFKTQSFSSIAKNFAGKIEFTEIANPILKYVVNPLLNIYWQIVKRII